MQIELDDLLHPQVLAVCKDLYVGKHFKSAAHEAMTLVELALVEKSGIKDKFGQRLTNLLFGSGPGIKLKVPFGDERQSQAAELFRGAFVYYRNYTAHDGRSVDEKACVRILIAASELLELIDASKISFSSIGGVKGLVEARLFADAEDVKALLSFLDGYTLPDEVSDGFFEELFMRGFEEKQMEALIDTGLVEYKSDPVVVPLEEMHMHDYYPETIGYFELTRLGREILNEKKAT